LDEGFNQLEALGATYRTYLTTTTKLLPARYDPSLIAVKSTHTPRTLGSAIGFLHGLYPPDTDGELVPVNETNFWWADDTQVLTGDPVFEARHPESRRLFSEVLEHFHWTNLRPVEMFMIGDFFVSSKCSNNTFDPIVNDEIYERMMEDFDFLTTNARPKMAEAELASIWKEVDSGIQNFLKEPSKAKFTLIGGHDVTLSSIYAGLGQEKRGRPPYAAHVAVEVWKRDEMYVRFVINGEVVKFDGAELTPLAKMRKRFPSEREL
jgi:acid phosphatase